MKDKLGLDEKQLRIEILTQMNDQFRQKILGIETDQKGTIVMTQGAQILNEKFNREICEKVGNYSDWDGGNDPYGEHDFGEIEVNGNKLFWKIEYYDDNLEALSPEPANQDITQRVLTIMLASEY